MEQDLAGLLNRLSHARTFEDAATVLLSAALDVVERALATSGYSGSSVSSSRRPVLRAMVHLRPDDGYRSLVAVDAQPGGKRGALSRGDGALVPSAFVWRWVRAHDCAAAVDLVSGEVTLAGGAAAAGAPSPKLDDTRSRSTLVKRDVTHLYGVPLRAPGGLVQGMLAIEAGCQPAIGEPFVWDACGPSLEALATIATCYLIHLPITATERSAPDPLLPVIGDSMQPVVEVVRVFAAQEETILLGGPTGAGKSRLARWCHAHSQARDKPFEVIHLATVPEELQMAELFGWRKGAFTGAAKDTLGAIERAEGGTLFVDEIDKLSLRAQAGLLRVLEDKKYRPLGEGAGDRDANVRFIIGTNTDLFALSKQGTFREDLYYRINVLPVRIPSLNDRRDEIVPWARHMLGRRRPEGEEVDITPEAARLLEGHDWPGNLRQLDNIVRRAYALALVNRRAGGLVLGASEVHRALEFEGKGSPETVWEHLERAAGAFVSEAERRATAGAPRLDMDVADAFKGLVLQIARRRVGGDAKESIRRAFILLGKEGTVEGRNHNAAFRRESDKLIEARRILGAPPAPDEGE